MNKTILLTKSKFWEWNIDESNYVRLKINEKGLDYKITEKDSNIDELLFIGAYQSIKDFKEDGPIEIFKMPNQVVEEITSYLSN